MSRTVAAIVGIAFITSGLTLIHFGLGMVFVGVLFLWFASEDLP